MNKAATVVPEPIVNLSDDLEALRQNPDAAMRRIYREHRDTFLRWAKGWTQLDESDLTDLFQDSVVILLKNVRSGRLATLNASLRTYLFGIGKNLLNARVRNGARVTFPGEENFRFPPDFDPGAEQQAILNEEEQHLQNTLARLGDNCQQLLRLTFYEEKKSAEIAAKMGYASEEVVRTQRKRCLDKLRNLFKPNA